VLVHRDRNAGLAFRNVKPFRDPQHENLLKRFGRMKKRKSEVEEPRCLEKTPTRLGAYPCQEKRPALPP
jgi:hypothetical protein